MPWVDPQALNDELLAALVVGHLHFQHCQSLPHNIVKCQQTASMSDITKNHPASRHETQSTQQTALSEQLPRSSPTRTLSRPDLEEHDVHGVPLQALLVQALGRVEPLLLELQHAVRLAIPPHRHPISP